MDKIRLLIAGDEPSARQGLTTIFASESVFEVLGSFPLNEAVEKATLLQPDMVVLDILEGISNCGQKVSEIKSGCPCSLILALVGDEHTDGLIEVLDQGLDGCVPRGIMRGCLVKTVELACQAGIFCLPSSVKKKVSFAMPISTIAVGPLKNRMPGNDEPLTKREMEILQLMAKNYNNREIGKKLFISEPTVKTHVSNILRKLGQNNRAQAIVYSFKMGLVKETEAVSK